MSISSPFASASSTLRSTSSLQNRVLIWAGLAGLLAVAMLWWGANIALERLIGKQSDVRIVDAAQRSRLLVEQALDERERQAGLLATAPLVIQAAREGNARAKSLGIVGKPIPGLEQQFAAERSMLVSPATRLYLRDVLPRLTVAEMLLTDENGFNAVITQRSSDFVQSDEAWWRNAWRDGLSPAEAAYDSSARQTTVSLAAAVQDGPARIGVLKLAFAATPLVQALARAGAGIRTDVIDSTGRIVLSSDSTVLGTTLKALSKGSTDTARAFSFDLDGVQQRGAMVRTDGARWRMAAHLPATDAAAPYRAARSSLLLGAAALLLVLLLLLVGVHQFFARRISRPAAELAAIAEAVAAGDFTVDVRRRASDDEIGRLGRAISAMILELRRLAQAISLSARETNAMSGEITGGAEEMAATAGEIANTASDLSEQATSMAETIGALATDANSLSNLSVTLDNGAREGVQRNTALRDLATANRANLDASAQSLGILGDDVHASAMAIEALADASTEIRSFVALVRKLARQSKLLALNAAMEAARAGEQGEGFAVVASEVRRLAAMSSDAAERTETVVNGVLNGIEESRESAGRAVAMADEVRNSTSLVSAAFSEIEQAVAEAEVWTTSLADASASTGQLVGQMTKRLEVLAGGTDTFAAAMEQVAASSEEQSAATQEIAGAANTLVQAADRLTKLVGSLKVEHDAAPAETPRSEPVLASSGPIRTLRPLTA